MPASAGLRRRSVRRVGRGQRRRRRRRHPSVRRAIERVRPRIDREAEPAPSPILAVAVPFADRFRRTSAGGRLVRAREKARLRERATRPTSDFRFSPPDVFCISFFRSPHTFHHFCFIQGRHMYLSAATAGVLQNNLRPSDRKKHTACCRLRLWARGHARATSARGTEEPEKTNSDRTMLLEVNSQCRSNRAPRDDYDSSITASWYVTSFMLCGLTLSSSLRSHAAA